MYFLKHRFYSTIVASILLAILFTITACGGGSDTGASGTPTPTPGTPVVQDKITPSPGIQLGPQKCPDAVKDTKYWEPIVGVQPGTSKVDTVVCGNLMGNPTLQALIKVRHSGENAAADLYVYNAITETQPSKVFELKQLVKGDARISIYNTLMTREVDAGSSVNKKGGTTVPDLYREFKWSDGAGTLVPIAFPGLFPHLTRYEAENDQQVINQGAGDRWKLNAEETAKQMATKLLKWAPNATTKLESGGKDGDVDAIITVTDAVAEGAGTISVELSRLEGNANGGIWIVTKVSSRNLEITSPAPFDILTSPVTVTGKGPAFEAVVGQVKVHDHLYDVVGEQQATGQDAQGNGNAIVPFTTPVNYTVSFKGGTQEGLAAIYVMSMATGGVSGVAIVKVLLS